MSDPNQPSTPPGWYPDGQGGQRWWDGTQWTEHTQPPAGGAPAAPPAPAAPSAPASPGGPGHDLPTQVAPNRAADYPAQPAPQQPPAQQPQGVYGAPPGQFGPGAQQPFGGFPAGGSGSGGGGKGKLIAIIGGGLGALILVLVLLFVLFKVVLGGSPEDVASDYLEATSEGDFGRVCELVSEDDREEAFEDLDVDDCGDVDEAVRDDSEFDEDEFEEYIDDFETEFEIGDVKEKEKTAEVEFTATTEYKGDDEEIKSYYEDVDDVKGTIKLVKEDGDWKVDADESDSAGIF